MCGIFGYIGSKNNPVTTAITGLERLEYRGYDSAGIAGIKNGEIIACKEAGKVKVLKNQVEEKKIDLDIVIAHTRWATHGKPTQANAHPHFDQTKSLALVHNGIIENHEKLRQELQEQGISFTSETDTEVIAQLIGLHYNGDLLKTVQNVIPMLEGSYAIALVHKDHPDQIVAIAHESPLVIGIGQEEAFISSDANAFAHHAKDVVYLNSGEIAVIKANKLEIYNLAMEKIEKEQQTLSAEQTKISKGNYEHFTLKEINEQPQTIRNAMLSRFLKEFGTAAFEEINFDAEELLNIKKILILACGTSAHAGLIAEYMLEDLARVPVQVEISSEFRYKNPIIQEGTFVIAISQSGETADTIAAVREVKAKGAKVLAICNVADSTLDRESDCCIYLRAGPEIGVCSTKAFTSQLIVLALFTLLIARMRNMEKAKGCEFVDALLQLPDQVKQVLEQVEPIKQIAKKYAKYQDFFFLGRRFMYPTALEGALKLKEISYINANGYPAGEMKHGPIALINEECPTVAFCANKMTYDKLLSNLMEVKARNGKVIAIAEEGQKGLDKIADEIIRVPKTIDELAAIPSSIAAQLFAYYVALERGTEIDQPRNLAKSVTVE